MRLDATARRQRDQLVAGGGDAWPQAAALGAEHQHDHAAPVDVAIPAVCKASADAVEHLAIAGVRNLADFLDDAKAAGAWTYGAAAGARPA